MSEKQNKEIKELPVEKTIQEKDSFSNKIRKNPWVLVSCILGLIVLILLVLQFSGITGGVISEKKMGESAVSFINTDLLAGAGTVTLDSVEKTGGLYLVSVNYQGNKVPTYFTTDGKYYVGNQIYPVSTEIVSVDPIEVPKSDKPKVELFVWGYCPYGVQAQEPFAEVASLLEDAADFEVALYYDGHGEYETQQNKIQACIQAVDPAKYWDYSTRFISDVYPKCGASREVSCDKTESIKIMKSLGIDSAKVMSCVDSLGASLTEDYAQSATEYGVTGSPTLIINGVIVQAARTAEAYKTAVCEAFNDAPSACDTVLSGTAAASSGSC